MACARNGSPCPLCHEQLMEEMKMIPARFLPDSVRTGLSQILDPTRLLPGSDYRCFADKNRLTPGFVEYLDSQKTQFNTSSIKAVLKYLIERDRDSFTVYRVYKTLCEMNSDGQRIIINGMPDIRRLYGQGSRPGQEDEEPLSGSIAPQAYPSRQRIGDSPSHPRPRDRSPPPPYDNGAAPQSVHMVGGDAPFALNNLDAGLSPGNDLDAHRYGGSNNRAHLPGKQDRTNGAVPEPSDSNHRHNGHTPCENPFHPNGFPDSPSSGYNFPPGERQAAEISFCSGGSSVGNMSPFTPPSYVDSHRQHGRTCNPHRMSPPSSTEMQDLKLPLEGPEVNPGSFSGQMTLQTASHVSGRRQEPSGLAPPANRPISFPISRPASYKHQHCTKRPVSESKFSSHSGACNCLTSQHMCVAPNVPSSYPSDDSLPSYVDSNHSYVSSLDMSEAGWDVSAEGAPWDEHRHQTEVKQPWNGCHETNAALRQQSMVPAHNRINSPAPCQQLSLTVHSSHQNGLTSKFVLVVAADMEETVRLDQHVNVFCQNLEAYGINYVVVRSTSEWPLVHLSQKLMDKLPPLPNDFKSVQDFVWGCYNRASKVLMIITPGYLRYADAYSENPGRVESYQQKLMRKIQEQLKLEFCERKRRFRILPVLLHEMKANRLHVPSLFSSSAYYWFPYVQDTENVMEILRQDLSILSRNVKRSN